MPSKYVVRTFTENAYYHVFNIGVEKNIIFKDEKDYNFFKTYLFIYLSPPKKVTEKYPDLPLRLRSRNLSKEVELIAYCLMPNHFHLLLRQKTKDGVSKLMKQIINAYTLFFNQRNKRSGSLLNGRFKAVEILDTDLLKHILRYIHLNPVASNIIRSLNSSDYKWSSYGEYLDSEHDSFLIKDEVLKMFGGVKPFTDFHLDQESYAKQLQKIKNITIEK